MTHLITVKIDQMSKGEAAAWIKAIAGMFGTDFVHECAEDIDPERVGEDVGEWVMPHTDIADARRKLDEYELERLRFDGDIPPDPTACIPTLANETVTGAQMLREEVKARDLAYQPNEWRQTRGDRG